MPREWKPGDVAMVRGDVCLRMQNGNWEHGRGDRFAYGGEEEGRPLVVIDPVAITGPEETGEDGDPLEEIANCLWRLAEADGAGATSGTYRGRVAARLADTFRALVAPHIDEPTGLGAVVRDSDGVRWVRASTTTTVNHWRCADASGVGRKPFARIDAVAVLSDGVQP